MMREYLTAVGQNELERLTVLRDCFALPTLGAGSIRLLDLLRSIPEAGASGYSLFNPLFRTNLLEYFHCFRDIALNGVLIRPLNTGGPNIILLAE